MPKKDSEKSRSELLEELHALRQQLNTSANVTALDESISQSPHDIPVCLDEDCLIFDAVFHNTSFGVAVVQHHQFIYVNPIAAKISGYSADELHAFERDQILKMVVSDDLFWVSRLIDRLFEGKQQNFHIRLRITRADGMLRWLDVHGSRIECCGKPALQMMLTDITDQKHVETLLNHNQFNMIRAQSMARLGIFFYDYETRVLQFSETLRNLLGLEKAKHSLDSFLSFVHHEDKQKFLASIAHLHATAEPFNLEFRFVATNSEIRYFHMVMEIEGARSGGQYRVTGIMQDISNVNQTQLALRSNQERLLQAIQIAHLGFWDWDMVNDTMMWFGEMFSIYGVAADTFASDGSAYFEYTREDYRDIQREHILGAIEKGITEEELQAGRGPDRETVELCIVRPDGTEVYTLAAAIALLDKDRQPVRMMGVTIDITEQKAAEFLLAARLRLSNAAPDTSLEDLLRAALNEAENLTNSQIGFFHCIEDEQRLWLQVWSTRAIESGTTPAEQMPHENLQQAGIWADAVRQRDVVIHNNYAAYAFKRGLPSDHIPLTRDLVVPVFQEGKIVATLGVANKPTNYSDADVNIVGQFANIAWDIVRRKRAEAAEQEQRNLNNALVTSAEVLNSTLDFDEIVLRMLEMLNPVVPHDGANVMLLTPDKTRVYLVHVCGCYEKNGLQHPVIGEMFNIETLPPVQEMYITHAPVIVERTTNNPRWNPLRSPVPIQSFAGAPIVIDDEVMGFINLDSSEAGFYQDHHKAPLMAFANQAAIALRNAQVYQKVASYNEDLEKAVTARTVELRAANTELEHLSKVKDDFVSNVSHELRAPINSINMQISMLRMDPAHQQDYIARLGRETDRLHLLIEDLLRLSRLDQNRVAIEMTLTDLNAVVSQLVADRKILAKRHQVDLRFETGTVLPLLRADHSLLEQVLSILLTNAFNYTPADGEVVVRMAQPDKLWGGFEVQDTGLGIAPDDLDNLFTRFYRGTAAHKTNVAGTGLGLAIAQEIIDRHGGKIEVESEVDKGSTFRILLPLVGQSEPHDNHNENHNENRAR